MSWHQCLMGTSNLQGQFCSNERFWGIGYIQIQRIPAFPPPSLSASRTLTIQNVLFLINLEVPAFVYLLMDPTVYKMCDFMASNPLPPFLCSYLATVCYKSNWDESANVIMLCRENDFSKILMSFRGKILDWDRPELESWLCLLWTVWTQDWDT